MIEDAAVATALGYGGRHGSILDLDLRQM